MPRGSSTTTNVRTMEDLKQEHDMETVLLHKVSSYQRDIERITEALKIKNIENYKNSEKNKVLLDIARKLKEEKENLQKEVEKLQRQLKHLQKDKDAVNASNETLKQAIESYTPGNIDEYLKGYVPEEEKIAFAKEIEDMKREFGF